MNEKRIHTVCSFDRTKSMVHFNTGKISTLHNIIGKFHKNLQKMRICCYVVYFRRLCGCKSTRKKKQYYLSIHITHPQLNRITSKYDDDDYFIAAVILWMVEYVEGNSFLMSRWFHSDSVTKLDDRSIRNAYARTHVCIRRIKFEYHQIAQFGIE